LKRKSAEVTAVQSRIFGCWTELPISLLFYTASRPALGPIQRVQRVQSGLCMKLTTHLHLAPRLRKHGAIPPIPR